MSGKKCQEKSDGTLRSVEMFLDRDFPRENKNARADSKDSEGRINDAKR
jgi:hypothetical protein